MPDHHAIAYIELPAADLEATKSFFNAAFGWTFTDWSPDYVDAPANGLMVGFYRAPLSTRQDQGGAVIGLYSDDLEQSMARVTAAGGSILQAPYAFPGGERFHFLEPSGNEFLVFTATPEHAP